MLNEFELANKIKTLKENNYPDSPTVAGYLDALDRTCEDDYDLDIANQLIHEIVFDIFSNGVYVRNKINGDVGIACPNLAKGLYERWYPRHGEVCIFLKDKSLESGVIDTFYDCSGGELKYRSIYGKYTDTAYDHVAPYFNVHMLPKFLKEKFKEELLK